MTWEAQFKAVPSVDLAVLLLPEGAFLSTVDACWNKSAVADYMGWMSADAADGSVPVPFPLRRLLLFVLTMLLLLFVGWLFAVMLLPLQPTTYEAYTAPAPWDAAPPDRDGPTPLLDLALERHAASRGELCAPRTEVERYERVGGGAHRWQVVACFFKTVDAGMQGEYGRCARLTVRAADLGRASPPLPPTQWPYAVESDTDLPGPRPADERLLLLGGA